MARRVDALDPKLQGERKKVRHDRVSKKWMCVLVRGHECLWEGAYSTVLMWLSPVSWHAALTRWTQTGESCGQGMRRGMTA